MRYNHEKRKKNYPHKNHGNIDINILCEIKNKEKQHKNQ